MDYKDDLINQVRNISLTSIIGRLLSIGVGISGFGAGAGPLSDYPYLVSLLNHQPRNRRPSTGSGRT